MKLLFSGHYNDRPAHFILQRIENIIVVEVTRTERNATNDGETFVTDFLKFPVQDLAKAVEFLK